MEKARLEEERKRRRRAALMENRWELNCPDKLFSPAIKN